MNTFKPLSSVSSVYSVTLNKKHKSHPFTECSHVIKGVITYGKNSSQTKEERIVYLDKNFNMLGKDTVQQVRP